MTRLPEGTLTFLLTDLEGSTHLLQRLGGRYAAVLDAHYRVLRDAFGAHGGQEVGTRGDALFVVFEDATEAVAGAVDAQLSLAAQRWPEGVDVRVRIGLETGEATLADDDYVGLAVHQAARICSAAHGGQVLVSEATRTAAGDGFEFRDVGRHRLKGLPEPLHLFQVVHAALPENLPGLRLDAVPGNLPKQITSFVGRVAELREAAAHLERGQPLLNLTGSGGCGKTRLALHVAAEVVDVFPDGAWLVELASVADPAQVPQAVASTLGIREEAGRPLTDTLTEALASRRLLLVLDNCEHVVDAAAALTENVLESCPGVQVLATTQEALGVPGEAILRVPPLAPEESVRLFVDRACLRDRTFEMNDSNAADIDHICRRLDGIPLAIELAAARVNVLTPRQIAGRLDDQFRLLTGGSRTAVPRQQTLRAAVDWSHDLLAKDEQALLRRLAVFAGGWNLEAAEDVVAGDGLDRRDVLDLLDRLVARSLVVVEEQDLHARYRLLETIRQYAQEKLVDAGEVVVLRHRHLDAFLDFALRAEPELTGPDQAAWLDRIAVEYDNLRAAMDWAGSRERADDGAALLSLAASLWRFWLVRGHWSEGRDWLARALATDAAARIEPTVARALAAAGDLATEQADLVAAEPLLQRSLEMWREIGEPEGTAKALNHLGNLARSRFEYDTARAYLREALEIRRAIGNERGMAVSLRNLGMLAALERDHQTARTLYEEALPLARRLGEKRVIATITLGLATVVFEDGDRSGARRLAEEGLRLSQELGDRQGIAEHLTVLAGVAHAEGDSERAAANLSSAMLIWQGLASRDAKAHVHFTLGYMALATHDYGAARIHLDTALAEWRRLGDPSAVARLLNLAGWAAAMDGDLAAARLMLEEGVNAAAELGDEGQRSATLHALGEVARLDGRLDEARPLLEESLGLARAAGWRTVLWWPVHSLGALARTEGRHDEAHELLSEAVALCPKLGRRPRLADCYEELAALALDEGDLDEAARLLGDADRLRSEAGTPVPPVRRPFVDALRTALAPPAGRLGYQSDTSTWT